MIWTVLSWLGLALVAYLGFGIGQIYCLALVRRHLVWRDRPAMAAGAGIGLAIGLLVLTGLPVLWALAFGIAVGVGFQALGEGDKPHMLAGIACLTVIAAFVPLLILVPALTAAGLAYGAAGALLTVGALLAYAGF
jgi:hypothetical protein